MSNKKKLIRERMAKTGESYQAAQRHVVGGGEGRGRFRAIARRAIALAKAWNAEYDALTAHLPIARPLFSEPDHRRTSSAYQDLLAFLRGLAPEDSRKLRMLMYSGREDESLLDMHRSLGYEGHEIDVSVMIGKAPLPEYLEAGLERAAADGIDLEAPLPPR